MQIIIEIKGENMKKSVIFLLFAAFLMPFAILFAGCGEQQPIQVSTYNEFVDAIKGDKSVIQLMADIELPEQVLINRKVTLDLNGKKLYNTKDIWNEENNAWSLIAVGENGDVTISGNGTIAAKENDCYCVDARDGGRLVIEDGEFIGNIKAVYAYEGNVEIKGGTYSILQKSSKFGYRLEINLYDDNRKAGTANLKIFGGTFKNFNPGDPMEEGYKILADGYEANLVADSETDYVVTKVQ